jgi:hypothetical protein
MREVQGPRPEYASFLAGRAGALSFGFRNWAADKPQNENSCMGWRTSSCQGSQLDGTVVVNSRG